ncbi:hypothetical protein V8F06_014091 [Rhypophila decipiens]
MHLKQLLTIASVLSMAAATPTPVSAPGEDGDIPFQHPDEQQPNVWYPASKYNHTLARRQWNLLHDIWAWSGNGCTGTAHFMGGYGPACFAVPANKRSLIYATGPFPGSTCVWRYGANVSMFSNLRHNDPLGAFLLIPGWSHAGSPCAHGAVPTARARLGSLTLSLGAETFSLGPSRSRGPTQGHCSKLDTDCTSFGRSATFRFDGKKDQVSSGLVG